MFKPMGFLKSRSWCCTTKFCKSWITISFSNSRILSSSRPLSSSDMLKLLKNQAKEVDSKDSNSERCLEIRWTGSTWWYFWKMLVWKNSVNLRECLVNIEKFVIIFFDLAWMALLCCLLDHLFITTQLIDYIIEHVKNTNYKPWSCLALALVFFLSSHSSGLFLFFSNSERSHSSFVFLHILRIWLSWASWHLFWNSTFLGSSSSFSHGIGSGTFSFRAGLTQWQLIIWQPEICWSLFFTEMWLLQKKNATASTEIFFEDVTFKVNNNLLILGKLPSWEISSKQKMCSLVHG